MNSNPQEPKGDVKDEAAVAAPKSEENQKTAAPAESKTTEKLNFFEILLSGALKPMTAFKEHLSKFEKNLKNAGILALIVVAIATALSTVTTVVGIVRTRSCTENCSFFSTGKKKYKTEWEWDNLEDFDWFKSVGQTFLFNALAIVLISGAYFGISKLLKSEKADFCRMATVVTIGTVPMIATGFVAPILGVVSETLTAIVALAGAVYSLSIIFVGLNAESGLEGDKKVYLNVLSLACVALAYYIIFRIMYGEAADLLFSNYSSLTSGFGGGDASSIDLDDLF